MCHTGNWLVLKLYYSPNSFLVSQIYKLPSFKNYIGCNMPRNVSSIFFLKPKQLFHELMNPPWHTYSINTKQKSALVLSFYKLLETFHENPTSGTTVIVSCKEVLWMSALFTYKLILILISVGFNEIIHRCPVYKLPEQYCRSFYVLKSFLKVFPQIIVTFIV